VPDDREGTELVAIVAEVEPGWRGQRQELAVAIRREVSRQSAITASFVSLVDERWLIKTSSGKLARGANRDKWLAERDTGASAG
jgi:hypothetical protein